MGEVLKFVESLGGGHDILFGAALAWLIIGQSSLKARAKEDREAARQYHEAADRRAKEDRDAARQYHEAADRRAKEDRDAAEQRAKEDRDAAEQRAKEDRAAAEQRAKEDRDMAEQRAKEDRAVVRAFHEAAEERSKEDREVARAESAKNAAEHAELGTAIHELKTQVGVLLDRSNRPGPGGSAD